MRPTARPSLNIDMSTLVFADPSYDRELSGPSPSDPQRDNAGVFWKLPLDRFKYGAATPLYFAFGSIDATTGAFGASPTPEGSLQLQRKPFKNDVPRIVDIIVDRSGQVRAAIIDFGGFLGVGTRKIAVDWRLIRFPSDGKMDNVMVDLTSNQLRVSPVFKAGEPVVVIGRPNDSSQ